MLAHFSGLSAANAANPCAYIASTASCPLGGSGLGGTNAAQFTATGNMGNLDPFFPNPQGLAGTLHTGNPAPTSPARRVWAPRSTSG